MEGIDRRLSARKNDQLGNRLLFDDCQSWMFPLSHPEMEFSKKKYREGEMRVVDTAQPTHSLEQGLSFFVIYIPDDQYRHYSFSFRRDRRLSNACFLVFHSEFRAAMECGRRIFGNDSGRKNHSKRKNSQQESRCERKVEVSGDSVVRRKRQGRCEGHDHSILRMFNRRSLGFGRRRG